MEPPNQVQLVEDQFDLIFQCGKGKKKIDVWEFTTISSLTFKDNVSVAQFPRPWCVDQEGG